MLLLPALLRQVKPIWAVMEGSVVCFHHVGLSQRQRIRTEGVPPVLGKGEEFWAFGVTAYGGGIVQCWHWALGLSDSEANCVSGLDDV